MVRQTEIDTALAAANQPLMVESAAQLQQAIEDWLACDVIGIDTEFVRERTWRANLGLVQISDGKRVWLVDPLKTSSLKPLSVLLETKDIVKILHAPSEDLGVLLDATDTCPMPLFDTQIACAMLGQSLQMGYHKTVEWLLNIAINKGETRSNWCKRPLRPAQLHYAALDVCLLPVMHRELLTRLEALDRSHWLAEDCDLMLEKARKPTDPSQAWMRINGNGRLDGSSLTILKTLATWRDREAETRNRARGFVITDAALLTIARVQPTSLDELTALDVLHPVANQRYARSLISTIEQAQQQDTQTRPLPLLEPNQRRLLTTMRELVQKKASEHSLEPALLASRRELESLIFLPADAPLPGRLLGWRKDIISDELLALKKDLT